MVNQRGVEIEFPAAGADLANAVRDLLRVTGPTSPDGICHSGICSMEECCRCGPILRAQKLLDDVPAEWLR